jgi:Flp pilus assembly CpaF family ATPase
MTEAQRRVIETAAARTWDSLIVGAMSGGKTTPGNAFLAQIAKATPRDRLELLDDTRELRLSADNVVALRTTATVDTQRTAEKLCKRFTLEQCGSASGEWQRCSAVFPMSRHSAHSLSRGDG